MFCTRVCAPAFVHSPRPTKFPDTSAPFAPGQRRPPIPLAPPPGPHVARNPADRYTPFPRRSSLESAASTDALPASAALRRPADLLAANIHPKADTVLASVHEDCSKDSLL